MDPALLKERELFKKKALALPTVERKKKEAADSSVPKDDGKKKIKPSTSSAPSSEPINFKSMSGSSQYKFGVLAKIVKHMKLRHQDGDDHPLTLDEILDETNQLDIGPKVKQWLLTESLANNPKIEVNEEGKFLFKAPYKIRDKKALLRLLKQHDLKGLGGILLEDVQESLPFYDKALKSLTSEIIYVTRPVDRKKIMFYNDKTANLPIEEDFQKLWRGVSVENMDDQKIEEYLEKQGIRSMQEHGIKKAANNPKRKKNSQKKRQVKKPRDNEHLADILETYEDK